MELLFVVLGGAILGLAARYSLPRRHTYGSALVPAIGTAVAAVVWVALTWLGWAWDGGWIWVVSFVAAGLASVASAVVHRPAPRAQRCRALRAALPSRRHRPQRLAPDRRPDGRESAGSRSRSAVDALPARALRP